MAAPHRVPTNDLVVWTLNILPPLWGRDLAVAARPAPAALDQGAVVWGPKPPVG